MGTKPKETSLTRQLALHIETLEDRIRRIRQIVDESDLTERITELMEIEEILREMDYDSY